ncbi:MAG: TadE/TadG family type IV pilus assembly protein [Pseudomonadota bacterium]
MNKMIGQQPSVKRQLSFLARLRGDVAGNVLMITAGAIIPLTAMIGAGVDTSRAYLAKSRLQQACDAGALAARKFMGGGTLTTDVTTKAQTFFGNNFPTGTYGTTDTSFTPSQTADGQVRGTATSRVPMTLMTIFGNDYSTINVTCDAKLEVGNSDIMLVLDITGSMACAPEDSSTTCSDYINFGGGFNSSTGRYVEKSNSRMIGLRAAVVDFFDELDSAVSDSSRVRYGIVPYSSNVNLGSTSMDTGSSAPGILRPEWLVDSWAYQSRDANMTTLESSESGRTNTIEVYSSGASISQSNCANYGRNQFPTAGTNPIVTGTPPATTTTVSYTNNANGNVDWGYSGARDTSGTTRSCRRTRTSFTTTYTGNYRFTDWTYQVSSLDVSTFKTGSTLRLARNGNGTVTTQGTYTLSALAAATNSGSNVDLRWTGCIEERNTVAADRNGFDPIPTNAFDLNIDLVPDSDATRWRPAISEMIYNRNNQDTETNSGDFFQPAQSNTAFSCNKRAWKLAERTRSEMNNYVYGSDFLPHGGTYHDIGMIWGARLISPTGLFASENATAPNGLPIDRHIIFMTDGDMSPSKTSYTMYGFEKLDNRIDENTATEDLKNRHNARFVAACNAARAKGITIWVVGFSQALTPQLTACADPGNSFTSSDTATLRRQFRQIASRIAQLRLER